MERAKEVMNLREASQYLGISPDTLYKYLGESKIPAFKLGNRWRFKKDLLDRWMERKSEHTLVVDSKSLKAVELIKIKKNFQLSGFAYEPISPDAVVDGAIMDFLPIAETIKTSFVGAKFKAKGVATGVSGHSVIVKRVVIPATTAVEVQASIQIDAEQYIPFDISEVNLDYQIVGPTMASDDAGMEVVLVAAKKDKIQNHTDVITLAGRTPEIVDIDAFALQNAFEANYKVDPDAAVALLNIGASLMNINITKGGMPLFIRDVSVGGNQYTDILQKELQLNFQEAEDLKLGRTGGSETEMVL